MKNESSILFFAYKAYINFKTLRISRPYEYNAVSFYNILRLLKEVSLVSRHFNNYTRSSLDRVADLLFIVL